MVDRQSGNLFFWQCLKKARPDPCLLKAAGKILLNESFTVYLAYHFAHFLVPKVTSLEIEMEIKRFLTLILNSSTKAKYDIRHISIPKQVIYAQLFTD